MEDIGWKEKLYALLKKYRYVVLVCLLGICLMMIPEKSEAEIPAETIPQTQSRTEDTAKLLSEILSKLYGAGKVEVVLTVAAGERTIYQTDSQGSGTVDSGDVRIETVIVTSSEKEQRGLVTQTIPEIYLGAIVLCQGADDPAVRLAIAEAVSDATGLGTDKISVLKMK